MKKTQENNFLRSKNIEKQNPFFFLFLLRSFCENIKKMSVKLLHLSYLNRQYPTNFASKLLFYSKSTRGTNNGQKVHFYKETLILFQSFCVRFLFFLSSFKIIFFTSRSILVVMTVFIFFQFNRHF